jgi:hypothetical protein
LNKLIICSLVAILLLGLIPFNMNGYSSTTNNSNETDLEESTSSVPEYTYFVNCINGTSVELGEKGEPGEDGIGSSGVSGGDGGNGSSSCWISTQNITANDRIVELAASGGSGDGDDGSGDGDDGSGDGDDS